ncbi:MAG TPA: hypothetical protein DCP97_05520 [Ruminococcaceae bacterium]|nr:hypothetical protein [Oscillospiraceae bacterium]
MSYKVLSQREIVRIINNAPICEFAIADKCVMPYVVPMYFYYSREERMATFYLITERNSQIKDILEGNPKASLLFLTHKTLVAGPGVGNTPNIRYTYCSVIADGVCNVITNQSQVDYIYNRISEKSAQDKAFLRRNIPVANAAAIKATIGNMTGRQYIF